MTRATVMGKEAAKKTSYRRGQVPLSECLVAGYAAKRTKMKASSVVTAIAMVMPISNALSTKLVQRMKKIIAILI